MNNMGQMADADATPEENTSKVQDKNVEDIDVGKIEETPIDQKHEPDWRWNENVEGKGDKPDWFLKDKYKTVEDQAKAYVEAQKRIGDLSSRIGNFKGAPDKYDFTDVGFNIDYESESFKSFDGLLRQKGVDNDLAKDLVKFYLDQESQTKEQTKLDTEKELAAIGPDAAQQIQNINNWAANNLDDSAANMVSLMLENPMADTVNLFKSLRKLTVSTQPPESASTGTGETPKDIQMEMNRNYDQYMKDEVYRSSIRKRLEEAMRSEKTNT